MNQTFYKIFRTRVLLPITLILGLAPQLNAEIDLTFTWNGEGRIDLEWNGEWAAFPETARDNAFPAIYTELHPDYAIFGQNSLDYVQTDLSLDGTVPWSSSVNNWELAAGSDAFGFTVTGLLYGNIGFGEGDTLIGSAFKDDFLTLTTLGFTSNAAGQSGNFNVGGQTINWSTAVSATPVPEPSTYAVFAGIGALLLAGYRRPKRQTTPRRFSALG